MRNDCRSWLGRLQQYVEKCRTLNPLPGLNFLSLPQILQHQIIKGGLLSRVKKNVFAEHHAVMPQQNPANTIILTSNTAGLAAAREIERETDLNFHYLYPVELHDFLRLYPDPEYSRPDFLKG